MMMMMTTRQWRRATDPILCEEGGCHSRFAVTGAKQVQV
jgi:hypothetical protein